MTTQTKTKVGFFDKISEIRKWVVLLLIVLVLFFGYKYFTSNSSNSTIEYDTNLIQQQIKNIGKLVVTEGHFSEVLTYKDQKKTYIPGFTFDKKALVVINADVTVSFDLSQVKYDIDVKNKILTIITIPNEEIKISPDIKYFNTESSTFNEFTGDDYNKIAKSAKESISKKIETSTLKTNAKNRLVSELSKMQMLTNSMGWTLKYNGNTIQKEIDFKL